MRSSIYDDITAKSQGEFQEAPLMTPLRRLRWGAVAFVLALNRGNLQNHDEHPLAFPRAIGLGNCAGAHLY